MTWNIKNIIVGAAFIGTMLAGCVSKNTDQKNTSDSAAIEQAAILKDKELAAQIAQTPLSRELQPAPGYVTKVTKSVVRGDSSIMLDYTLASQKEPVRKILMLVGKYNSAKGSISLSDFNKIDYDADYPNGDHISIRGLRYRNLFDFDKVTRKKTGDFPDAESFNNTTPQSIPEIKEIIPGPKHNL